MTPSRPTTSVIVPTYNRSALLRECLESIVAQTLAPTEVIVVDDGSTDDTAGLVEAMSLQHEERTLLRYAPQEHRGVSTARNTGLRLAVGDVVFFLDSDDAWEPDYVHTAVEAFERHPSVGVVLSRYRTVDEAGVLPVGAHASYDAKMGAYRSFAKDHEGDLYLCDSSRVVEALVLQQVIPRIQTVSFCRARIRHHPFFEPAITFGEDFDFLVRLVSEAETVGYVDRPLVRYVLHGANTVSPGSAGRTPREKIHHLQDIIAVHLRLLAFCRDSGIRRQAMERIAARFRLLGWLADEDRDLALAEDSFMTAYLFGRRKLDGLRVLRRRIQAAMTRT